MQSLEAALEIEPENTAASRPRVSEGDACTGRGVEAVVKRKSRRHDDAPVAERVDVFADEAPLVYDGVPVEDAPIEPPSTRTFRARDSWRHEAAQPSPERRLRNAAEDS